MSKFLSLLRSGLKLVTLKKKSNYLIKFELYDKLDRSDRQSLVY